MSSFHVGGKVVDKVDLCGKKHWAWPLDVWPFAILYATWLATIVPNVDFIDAMIGFGDLLASHILVLLFTMWFMMAMCLCIDSQVNSIIQADACKVTPAKFSGSKKVVPLHFRSQRFPQWKQSFKNNLPVVTYEDYHSYIDRIANGEPFDLICDRPIIVLLASSGTSGGVPKLIPFTAEELEQRMLFISLYRPILFKHIEGRSEGKSLMFYFVTKESETASGLMVRTMITCVLKSVTPANKFIWDQGHISPHEISTCEDTTQSMYCQLLCGLVERGNVSRLGAPFASTFLKVIKFLENHWSELCSNIRTGRVSDWITDANCVSGIGKFLEAPNPELASLIEQKRSKTSWEAIVRRLWPNAKCIEAVVTGSECFIGLNLDPLSKPCDASYSTIPSVAYFEFLEIKKDSQETGHDPVVLDLVDVKVGHDYEPVITTFSGLYRYRLGDVLRVTGFYNNAPQFRFVGRQKVVLSIDMDKTYEEDLLKAVANAKLLLEPHELMLIDFTSRVDSSSFPGHYVLYWELGCKVKDVKVEPDPEVMEECCFAVEE
ncbi:hypothetical protein F2Q70_00029319, partial [Brassica cretica]